MGGSRDPGPLAQLVRPNWQGMRGRAARHARAPVRVADVKGVAPGKVPGKPDPAAVKALLDRIESGKSKLSIDLAYFAVAPARANEPTAKALVERGEGLRKEYLAYMKELAGTGIGFRLLSELDKSPHKTVIQFDLDTKRVKDNFTKSAGTGGASNGKGEPPTITMNPAYTSFTDNQGRKDAPWMSERQKYGFYHELVHGWHITNGTQATGLGPHDVRNSEWQTTGLGKYGSEKVSDNAIRRAMGKAERPDYNGFPPN